MARDWGWWTEQKLDILFDYLVGFSNASRKAEKTVYLDLFAGQAENISRERTRHRIDGSPRRALDVQPPLSVLRFFELPSRAGELNRALKADYPGRDFRVIPGDCNDEISSVLGELSYLNWAPTFAFLDQQSTEVRWSTLEQLAKHKKKGKTKTELWLLCASGLLPRGLKVRQDIDAGVVDRMNTMFDTDLWFQALEATREGRLTPEQFRSELTNLMRWRLEQSLGYKKTRVFSVENTSGTQIFDMIFATDHDVGDKIMKWVYSSAVSRQPALQLQARLRRKETRQEEAGVFGMFDIEQFVEAPKTEAFHIEHADIPPRPPYRHR
jgi:three-Cys-motif partner protein